MSNLYGYTVANAASASANFSKADQTTDIWFVGGDYNFSQALNLAVGWYDVNLKASADLAQKDGNGYYYSALLDYKFSKRTDIYGGLMYSKFEGDQYPSATNNTTNSIYAFGMRHKF